MTLTQVTSLETGSFVVRIDYCHFSAPISATIPARHTGAHKAPPFRRTIRWLPSWRFWPRTPRLASAPPDSTWPTCSASSPGSNSTTRPRSWRRLHATSGSTKPSLASVRSRRRSTPPWPPCAVFSTGRQTPSASSATPLSTLTDVAAQPLAPKGFSDVERRRLVREAEKAGPMADAIVMLLLHTGLRVDELVTLTWERSHLQARSGWIDVVGKGDKHPTASAERRGAQFAAGDPARARRRRWWRRVPRQTRAIHGTRDRVPGCRTRPARTGPECASASFPPRRSQAPGRVGRPAHRGSLVGSRTARHGADLQSARRSRT